jgi:hypothetical protein
MSEVIVRMEMPKRCYECDLADGVVCMATGGVYGREVPQMTWIRTRPSWCPIIGELPEQHGRIIDEAVFCENVVKYSHQSTKTIGKALDATPTIIDMTPIVAERSET